jgi:hypothetical protein
LSAGENLTEVGRYSKLFRHRHLQAAALSPAGSAEPMDSVLKEL